jgi:hypothetical protein
MEILTLAAQVIIEKNIWYVYPLTFCIAGAIIETANLTESVLNLHFVPRPSQLVCVGEPVHSTSAAKTQPICIHHNLILENPKICQQRIAQNPALEVQAEKIPSTVLPKSEKNIPCSKSISCRKKVQHWL